MPAESAPPAAFKHWYDAARYQGIADELSRLSAGFDRKRFLALTLDGLEERELMDRMRQTAIACQASLPGGYRAQVRVLRALAPKVGHSFVAVSLCDFVARYGLAEPKFSLDALKFLTVFGSAEFAVRPFLQRDLEGTLAVMTVWAGDPDERVRRLASEGSRPRLPWGLRLTELVRDPRPTGAILEKLKADPALFVRKSVANHLNDIAKDHPEAVLARIKAWDRSVEGTAWIARHALRTLIKRGDARALTLLGASSRTEVEVAAFTVAPARIRLGDQLQLRAELVSASTARSQTWVVDYVIHYVKASGAHSAKVFKWRNVTVEPGARLTLVKNQSIRDFSTRRHFAGVHRVELQINGRRPAEAQFELVR